MIVIQQETAFCCFFLIKVHYTEAGVTNDDPEKAGFCVPKKNRIIFYLQGSGTMHSKFKILTNIRRRRIFFWVHQEK